MTDEVTPQAQQNAPKKDEKKPPGGNNRGPKRNAPNPRSASGSQGGPRPSSRTGNKKAPNAGPNAPESGSDTTSRKGSEAKKSEPRPRNPGNNARVGPRKQQNNGAQASRPGNTNGKETQAPKQTAMTSPTAGSAESSDALSSLQRVIADLKTTSPVPPVSGNNQFNSSTSVPQVISNLPANAPVFQPGAAAYPGLGVADPKHRKAVSLGTSGLSGNFPSFSPHLGAMIEDAEDGAGNSSFNVGEESYYPQPGHQPRSQSQSFMAPRFAALAQQEQDPMGPTGRPQLAPGFMFGARRRGSANVPMGPPINEEDVGFQFPQQQQPTFHPEPTIHEQSHRKTDSGEITGIMAEQVCYFPQLF